MVKEHFVRQVWISFGIIVASIVIAAAISVFFSGQISAQADAIVSDRAMAREKSDAVANLAALEAQAAQAAQYQPAIDQLLPNQYGLVTFTQWLAQLGAKYSVTTDAAFQGSVVPSTASTAGTAQFSFSAEGSPDNLTAFLDGINAESAGFLITMTSFNVTNVGPNENITGQGILFFK